MCHDSCPLCGKDNGCRVAKGHLYKDVCWCQEIIVPSAILHRLAEEWPDPGCLCRPCLEIIARISREFDGAAEILDEVQRIIAQSHDAPAASDYYLEEGKMVFTESYHLKRGHCCDSGCRHCPY